MEMYRQGGVLLIPVDGAPLGQQAPLEEDGSLVLFFKGDRPFCTIVGGGVSLIVDQWSEGYLTVTNREGVDLVHEGRATVRVRPGVYRVGVRHGFGYWPRRSG